MIYSILYNIQISWYKHIFINQLQQYKNKIEVQFSSADFSIPFSLPHTWYCLIHFCIMYVYLY